MASFRRAAQRTPKVHAIHLGALRRFIKFSGREALAEVSLGNVERWIEHMRRNRAAYGTRRHALIHLRQALRRAPAYGLPDVLAGVKRLDEREEGGGMVQPPPFEEAFAAMMVLPTARQRLAVGLMLVCGLRVSEVQRLNIGDVTGGIALVGERERKNRFSRRAVTLPGNMAAWAKEASGARPATAPLITDIHRRRHASPCEFGRMVGYWIPWKAKLLRKCFATRCLELGLNEALIERAMGHRVSTLSAITTSNYVAAAQARTIAPVFAAAWKSGVVAPHPTNPTAG